METIWFPHEIDIISTHENDIVSILWCLTMERTSFPPIKITRLILSYISSKSWKLCGFHVDTTWTQHGYNVDTMWFPGGHHVVSMWTPHGFHVSMWSPSFPASTDEI